MTKPVRHLVAQFKPHTYNVILDLTQRSKRTFSGEVAIHGELVTSRDQIILHSKGLVITDATIDGQHAQWKEGKDDELHLSCGKSFTAGAHDIRIAFRGVITDPMHGIYPCYFKHDGKDKELLMTQLESHHAREAFPCIDEPAAKAVFTLTLRTEPGLVVLGNTPVVKSIKDDDSLVTVFEPTPKMSTYLLAFVVGELGYAETVNKNGVLIRCYSTPDNVKNTQFALDFAAKCLAFYDEYFAVPYPLPKCDLVAVPDFAAGAMENWGLITFRESAMLYDPKNSPAETKEWVAAVVTHELAHQWFGNLVTMKWWDDLWLNESFAKWMEHYAVDKLVPEWQVWQQFGAHERQHALSRDSLAGVQAVREPVRHPDELHSLFDPAIVYAKGACLILMLQQYLGDDTFREGLRIYMKKHQYGNAVADDLWEALNAVSKKDVGTFMHQWLDQPGHPVVSVQTSNTQVALAQQRFFSNPSHATTSKTAWPLPLLSDQLKEDLFTQQSQTFTASALPVMINRGYTGFYHTQYDEKVIADIATLIADGKVTAVDRQGLLIDNVALAKAGLQPSVNLLTLLDAYKDESEHPVWEAMSSAVGALRTIVNDDPVIKPDLQRYVASLARKQFERLGWTRIKDEPYFDELLRPTVIALMGYAEDPAATTQLLELFDAANKPEDIALPELRSIVYAVAVRQRGRPAYEKLLGWYRKSTSADERVNLIAGITNMRELDLAREMTALFTTKDIKLQDLVYWFIYSLRNRFARPATWEWIVENWDWIRKQYKNSHDYSDLPKYSASCFSTREELEQYKKFFEPKLHEQDLAMVIRQGIEDIGVRVLWRERDLQSVATALKATS